MFDRLVVLVMTFRSCFQEVETHLRVFVDHASYEDLGIRLTALQQVKQNLSDPWLGVLVQAAYASLQAMDASPHSKEIHSAVEQVTTGGLTEGCCGDCCQVAIPRFLKCHSDGF